VEHNRRLSDKLGMDFPLLSDSDATAIRAFGVLHQAGGMGGVDIARPASFLIDRDGSVVWRELTDNWRVRLRPERVLEAAAALR